MKYNAIMKDRRMITFMMLVQGILYIIMPKGSLEWEARVIIGSGFLYVLGLLIEFYDKNETERKKSISIIILILLIALFIRIDIVIRLFDRLVGVFLLVLGIYNTDKKSKKRENNFLYYLSLLLSICLILIGLLFIIKPVELGMIGMRVVGVILILNAISDFWSIYKFRKIGDNYEKRRKI